jgi:hypothetical protein
MVTPKFSRVRGRGQRVVIERLSEAALRDEGMCSLLGAFPVFLGTYFAPWCPLFVFNEKSMWMRVTSRGKTAAPGPFLIASSW